MVVQIQTTLKKKFQIKKEFIKNFIVNILNWLILFLCLLFFENFKQEINIFDWDVQCRRDCLIYKREFLVYLIRINLHIFKLIENLILKILFLFIFVGKFKLVIHCILHDKVLRKPPKVNLFEMNIFQSLMDIYDTLSACSDD